MVAAYPEGEELEKIGQKLDAWKKDWEELLQKTPEKIFLFDLLSPSFKEKRQRIQNGKDLDVLKEKYSIANSGVLNNIGYYYMGQNNLNLDYALAIFQTNIKLFPDEANPHDSLGECFVRRGDNANAIKYYKMAYDKLDTDPAINDVFRDRLRTGIKDILEDLGAKVSS